MGAVPQPHLLWGSDGLSNSCGLLQAWSWLKTGGMGGARPSWLYNCLPVPACCQALLRPVSCLSPTVSLSLSPPSSTWAPFSPLPCRQVLCSSPTPWWALRAAQQLFLSLLGLFCLDLSSQLPVDTVSLYLWVCWLLLLFHPQVVYLLFCFLLPLGSGYLGNHLPFLFPEKGQRSPVAG